MSPRTESTILAALLALMGCGEPPAEEPPEANAPPADVAENEPEPDAEEAEEPEPEPTGPPKRIFARRFVVPVRAAPSREAERIGYLRAGSVLMAKTAEPVGRERCREGWYELTTGGFVCNGRHVIAFEGERLPAVRSRQPSREDPLPYEYGFIRRRVPQYRRPPTLEEASEHEGFRMPGAEPDESEASEPTGMSPTEMTPTMAAVAAAMAPSMEPSMAEMTAMAAMAPAAMEASAMEASMAAVAEASGEEGDGEEEEDQGPTLSTLQGDPDSVVIRTLMRGFFVSLDRDFRRDGRRYWRTQNNGFVPYNAVLRRSGSEFHGV